MKRKGLILILLAGSLVALVARDYRLDERERIDLNGVDEIVIYMNTPHCVGCFSTFSLDGSMAGGSDRNLVLRLEGDMTSNKAKAVPELLFDRKGNTLEVSLYPERLTIMGLVSRGNIFFGAEIPGGFRGRLTVRSDSGDLDLNALEELEELRVRSSSGDVRAKGISAAHVVIDTSSGDQELDGIYAQENLTVDSSSGDVDFTVLSAGDTLSLDLSSGDLNGKLLEGERIGIDSSSGEIDAERLSGKSAMIKSSSGDISIGRIDVAESVFESHSGDVELDSVAGYTAVDCSSGAIDVVLESAEYGADLEASSGKVTVMVPRGSAYSVDLRTSSGMIRCENTIIGVVNDDRDEVRGDANGGGGLIRVRASSGNITVDVY